VSTASEPVPSPAARKALPLSVVVPVHNREGTLARTLQSIEAQEEYRVSRVIVIDDASTDGSAQIARDLGYDVVVMPVNVGIAGARNAGLSHVDTPWVCFLDSDDEWMPHLLRTLWPSVADHVLVCATGILIFDGEPVTFIGASRSPGETLDSPRALLLPENPILPSGALVRTDVVRRAGGFDPGLPNSEDFDLWLRVLELGTGWCDATPTLRYFRGDTSNSQEGGASAVSSFIAHRYAGRAWWSRSASERYLGGMYWEASRAATRRGDHARALAAARRCLRGPRRIQGVMHCLIRHSLLRRRFSTVMAASGSRSECAAAGTVAPRPRSGGA
jgi:glycosyltransferase involved in cell wall biosynthesis